MKERRPGKNISRRQMLETLGKAGLCVGSYPFARSLLGLGSWAWAEQAKPKSLIHSTYGGDYGKVTKQAFEDPFTEKTGIKIIHDVGTNPARFTKLKLQRDNPKSDIGHFQDRFFYRAESEGLLDKLNPANLKNLKDIYPAYVHDTWVAYQVCTIGIVYNTEHVKKEIRSWDDIFDEAYRGRTFIDAFGHFGLACLIALARMKGGGEDHIDPGFELLAKFKKMTSPRYVVSSQEAMHLYRTGEIWISMWQKPRTIALMNEGLPIRYVSPIEGDAALQYGTGVVKGTKHKEWVEKYIDETLDPKNQLKFAKLFPIFPTNRKIKFPPDLEAMGYTEEEMARQFSIDHTKVLPELDGWVERWNKEIAPKS